MSWHCPFKRILTLPSISIRPLNYTYPWMKLIQIIIFISKSLRGCFMGIWNIVGAAVINKDRTVLVPLKSGWKSRACLSACNPPAGAYISSHISNAHNAASGAFMMSLEQNKLPNLVSEQSCTMYLGRVRQMDRTNEQDGPVLYMRCA
jgi:hypothetical protein